MRDSWSPAEKVIARRAYDEAFEVARARIVAEVKRRAAAAESPEEIFAIEIYLREARSELNMMFDYRYSRLIGVFSGLVSSGFIDESRLSGLASDKREAIRNILRSGMGDSQPLVG